MKGTGAIATANSANAITRRVAAVAAEARSLNAMWLEVKVIAAKGTLEDLEIWGAAAAEAAKFGAPGANVYALIVEYLRGAVRSRLDAGAA